MIAALVGFDTTSRESNLGLIEFVRDYLSDHGVDSRLVANEAGDKANLVATIGPARTPGGVVLSGHSDVVPVDGQPWSSDPFRVVRRDGRLYGRGTCDMKGFIGAALALVPEFLAADLRAPIHLVLTYDEETDCGGATQLAAMLPALGLDRARAVIIGEPTEMRVINAHKGHYCFETHVVGHEAHSSLPGLGVNAITTATRLIARVEEIARSLESRPASIAGLEPPWSTINVGTIGGGTEFNIVPRECRFQWDLRPVPGEDVDAVLARFEAYAETLVPAMKAIAPGAGVTTTRRVAVPPFAPAEGSPAETLVKQLAATNEAGASPFGTEAPCYQQAGLSVVVFGPGSIEQAHKPDEFLALDQLDACVAFLRRLCARLAEPASEPTEP
jgi:acetylornithine deacetylase